MAVASLDDITTADPDLRVEIPPQVGGRAGQQLAYKNNNPGNIEYVGQPGAEPSEDGRFAKFATPEAGYADLHRVIGLHKDDTLEKYLTAYAPPSENDTAAYVAHASKALGVTPDTPVSKIDRAKLAAFQVEQESSSKVKHVASLADINGSDVAAGDKSGNTASLADIAESPSLLDRGRSLVERGKALIDQVKGVGQQVSDAAQRPGLGFARPGVGKEIVGPWKEAAKSFVEEATAPLENVPGGPLLRRFLHQSIDEGGDAAAGALEFLTSPLGLATSGIAASGEVASGAVRSAFAGAQAPAAMQRVATAVEHPTPENVAGAAVSTVGAALPMAPEIAAGASRGVETGRNAAGALERHNVEAERLVEAERQRGLGTETGAQVLGGETMPVKIGDQTVTIKAAGGSDTGRPFYQVLDAEGKPIFAGFGQNVQEFLRQRGARPLNEPAPARYPNAQPTGTLAEDNAPAPRKTAAPASIPEEGAPEDVQRAVDARDRLAQDLAGKPFKDLSNPERLVVDEFVNQGYGFSVQKGEGNVASLADVAPVQPVAPQSAQPADTISSESKAVTPAPVATSPETPPNPASNMQENIPARGTASLADIIADEHGEPLMKLGTEAPEAPETFSAPRERAPYPPLKAQRPVEEEAAAAAAQPPGPGIYREGQRIAEIPQAEAVQKTVQPAPSSEEKAGLVHQPSVASAVGREVSIAVPGGKTSYPARYAVMEASDVQTSHNPQSFEPNPAYPHQNDRDYSQVENAARVVNAAQDFRPEFVLTESPTAEHGPTIVDQNGNALGGNNRAMALKRVYESANPEAAADYREQLSKNALQLGIAPAELARFKQPVLVRQVTGPLSAQTAITDFNKTATAALNPAEQAVSDGRRLSKAAMTVITGRLDDLGEEGTLAQALKGEDGAEVLARLVKDGVLTEQEKNGYLDERGFLTPDIKDRIAKAIVGRLFSSPKEMQQTPAELRAKVEKIAPQVLRVEDRPEWNLTEPVKEALAILADARAHGNKNLDDLTKQATIGEARQYSPAAIRIAEVLKQSPLAAAKAFRAYANDEAMSRDKAQTTLYSPPSQHEAFSAAFGAIAKTKPEAAAADVHKFSSTQVDLPKAIVAKVKAAAAKIPASELAEDGREAQPHITVLYGLHSADPAEAAELLAGSGPVEATVGKISIFKGKDADVVKLDVTSPDLARLNTKLRNGVEFTNDHPDYKPHITLAYVKPGAGKKYVGREVPGLTGETIPFDSVTFSSKNGTMTPISLTQGAPGETRKPGLLGDERGSATLSTLTLGLDKFIAEDIAPTLGEAARTVSEASDDILKILLPAARGPNAQRAALIMRNRLAELARSSDRAEAALATARKFFEKGGDEAGRKFILDYFADENAALPQSGSKELDGIARVLRNLLDSRREEVQSLGKGKLKGYYTNYFPRIWKDWRKAEGIFASFFGRRPLEGGKSFLKQRKYPTIKDALDAGLEPVSWNPIDLVLLKVREMDRYLMAHRTLEDWKASGLAKFVDARGAQAPTGWQKIADQIGTVYAPSIQDISEFPNEQIWTGLLKTAEALGLDHRRGFKNLRNAVGRAHQGTGVVETMHGSSEQVLAHEIGHQIDWLAGSGKRFVVNYPSVESVARIREARKTLGAPASSAEARKAANKTLKDMKPDIQQRKQFQAELRALADLRLGGARTAYTHKREEKMALLAEMWVGARELFEKTAPLVFKEWKQFLSETPKLEALRDIEAGTDVTRTSQPYDVGGLVIRGNWYAPEGAARILNNYLSPSLRTTSGAYKAVLGANNVLNQFQLGLSAFHLGFTSADAGVSKTALGYEALLRGKPVAAAKAFAGVATAPFTTMIQGNKLLREWYKPGSEGAWIAQLVDSLVAAGGRARMDDIYGTAIADRMRHAFRNGNVWGGLIRAPFAGVEAISNVMMKEIVPRQKLGVFADIARFELERLGPEATFEETRAAMAKAWDSVENRMGQMTYDNLFWNRTAKDLAMLAVRSVGWNLGTIREVGGGIVDLVRIPLQIAGGKPPAELNLKRITYLMGLLTYSAIVGAIYQYLRTGKGPEEPKDYFFPKTGQLDEAGRPQRASLPTYVKDIYHYFTEPGKTLANKVAPIWSVFGEMVRNEDFYGTEIRGADDPLVDQMKELAEYGLHAIEPFGVRNYERDVQMRNPTFDKMQRFVGVVPAPAAIEKSKAERLASELAQEHIPAGSRTHGEAQRRDAEQTIARLAKAGKDYADQARDYVQSGILTAKDAHAAALRSQVAPLLRTARSLPLDDLLRVWKVATPEERDELRPLLKRHLSSVKDLPIAQRKTLTPRLQAALTE